jgi:hypothetical protein
VTFFLSRPVTLGGMLQNSAPTDEGHTLILRTTNQGGSLRMLTKTLEDRASVPGFSSRPSSLTDDASYLADVHQPSPSQPVRDLHLNFDCSSHFP